MEFTVDRSGDGEVFSQTGQIVHGSFTVPTDGTYVFRIRNTSFAPAIVTWTVTRPSAGVWILAALVALVAVILVIGLIARWQRMRARRPPQIPLYRPR
mgnify:CR=1 FL=1